MVYSQMSNWLQQTHPALFLTIVYVSWKTLLFITAITSPGVGYDTSTALLEDWSKSEHTCSTPATFQSPLLKLVRWDAIYYTQMTQNGHVFEQEWAFGIGLSSVLAWVTRSLNQTADPLNLTDIVLSGLLVSHLTHWLTVLLIWNITKRAACASSNKISIATVAAFLHIFSPAGIFLSAPYSESLFALLNMLGFLLYITGMDRFEDRRSFSGITLIVLAGASHGIATVIRSNGLLSGISYALDAVRIVLTILNHRFDRHNFLQLASVVVGGSLVGIGLLFPQYVAYQEYCTGLNAVDKRSWCMETIPSIFTFVQSHYWNVGLFRYWTFSNLPLFILASPTLALLIISAMRSLQAARVGYDHDTGSKSFQVVSSPVLVRLALPQLALAVLAILSYHVQIIARLSSGYPMWYIWLAVQICNKTSNKWNEHAVRWMILYASIQAGLYAAFLPPA